MSEQEVVFMQIYESANLSKYTNEDEKLRIYKLISIVLEECYEQFREIFDCMVHHHK